MWVENESINDLKDKLVLESEKFEDSFFLDHNFPPNQNSINISSLADKKIIWRRSKWDYDPKQNLYDNDVHQGQIGDCWFLTVANLISKYPDLLAKILVIRDVQHGFCIFKFFKEGCWRMVFIDDLLPTVNGKLIFASSSDPNNDLYSLMEKAYAKIQGGYEKLSNGSIAYAFSDLTGEPCENLDEFSWNLILNNFNKGWLLAASYYDSRLKNGAELENVGLYANHAYAIMDTLIINNDKLLHLHNPWGRKEWKGSWSDGSKKWTSTAIEKLSKKQKIKISNDFKDDGDFWIEWNDFTKYFNKLTICRLYNNDLSIEHFKIYDSWKDENAGGCQNYSTWTKNPKYSLISKKTTEVFINLEQMDIKWSKRKSLNRIENFGIAVIIPGINQNNLTYIRTRSIGFPLFVEKGVKCTLIPTTFNPNEFSSFILSVYSTIGLVEIKKIQ